MRVTLQYLKETLQKEFDRLEIEWVAHEIHKTHFRQNDYESGAVHYIINIYPKKYANDKVRAQVYIFYPIHYLQKELNEGYELYFKPRQERYLNESELDIRKKLNPDNL